MSDLTRALEFMAWVENRCSTRVAVWRWGEAVFNDDFPKVFDFNFLRVDGVPEDLDFEKLIDEAERLHSDAGHGHRKIVIDDEILGRALQLRFQSQGWEPAALLVMVYRGGEAPPPSGEAVREISLSELREVRAAAFGAGPIGRDPEAMRQLLDKDAVYLEAGNGRFIAALVDGRAVCSADLYSDGSTAQIEAVLTLEPYRKRGLATAVVNAAVATALAERHDFVFLIADEEDWPKEMYARLGFEPIGVFWDFTKTPD